MLLGTSLGAAVAIQEAAHDPRVSAIVAVETFSDLRTVATERAPVFFTSGIIERAFQLAELRGHFRVDAVSPVEAAAGVLESRSADSRRRPTSTRGLNIPAVCWQRWQGRNV